MTTKPNDYGLPSPLTEQAIFDKVAVHLLRQGRPSAKTVSLSSCAYRGYGGTACSVGCLIADDRYHTSMEYLVAAVIVGGREDDRFAVDLAIRELLPFENLIDRLQGVHDNCSQNDDGSFASSLIGDLREVADGFGLSATVLEQTAKPLPESLTIALLSGRRETVESDHVG